MGKYLDDTGVAYLWSKIKTRFAAASHTHAASDITSGTLSAARGGTGESTLNNSANALINALSTGSSNITDDDTYIITENTNATEDKYYRRPVSKLWPYIKGKADSVYAALSHTHAAGDVTSGTFGIARIPVITAAKGGTGETSLAASAKALGNALDVGAAQFGASSAIAMRFYNTSTSTYSDPMWNAASVVATYLLNIAGVGTVKSKYDTASATSGTSKEVAALSLEAGTWVVTATVLFYSNATGYRNVKLSTTSADTSLTSYYSVTSPAASGASTILSRSVIVQPSETTTYYLNVLQNSGSSITCEAQIKAVRIA